MSEYTIYDNSIEWLGFGGGDANSTSEKETPFINYKYTKPTLIILGTLLLFFLIYWIYSSVKSNNNNPDNKSDKIGKTLRMGEGGTILMANKNNSIYDNFEKSDYLLNVQGGDMGIHPGNGFGVEVFEETGNTNKGLFLIPNKHDVIIQPPTLKGEDSPENFLKITKNNIQIGKSAKLCFGEKCIGYEDIFSNTVKNSDSKENESSNTNNLALEIAREAAREVVREAANASGSNTVTPGSATVQNEVMEETGDIVIEENSENPEETNNTTDTEQE